MADTTIYAAQNYNSGSVVALGSYEPISAGSFVDTYDPNNYYLVSGQGTVSGLPAGYYRVHVNGVFQAASGVNITFVRIGMQYNGNTIQGITGSNRNTNEVDASGSDIVYLNGSSGNNSFQPFVYLVVNNVANPTVNVRKFTYSLEKIS